MCNLYRLSSGPAEIGRLFSADITNAGNAAESVYPGYNGFVIRDDDGRRVLEAMTWGFPLVLADARRRAEAAGKTARPRPINNARDDKLLTPMWKRWFTDPGQRCLIPFNAFAEAEGEKGKMTRTWFTVRDQEIPAWAGLWRPTAEWGNSYTGVMVDANAEYLEIHDRMPVILAAKDHEVWLKGSVDDALAIVKQYPPAQMAVERTPELWHAKVDRTGLST